MAKRTKSAWRACHELVHDLLVHREAEDLHQKPCFLVGMTMIVSPRLLGAGAHLLAVVALAIGCAGGNGSVRRDRNVVCPPPLAGEQVLRNYAGPWLVGETHGTNEAPRLFGDMVCRLVVDGGPVSVALEMPVGEEAAIDAFLHAESVDSAARHFASNGFWTRAWQDGRSSSAMASLLDRLRMLVQAGYPVQVVTFDGEAFDPAWLDSKDLDAKIEQALAAALVRRIEARPAARWLVLTGALHARLSGRAGEPPPMGALLAEKFDETLEIRVLDTGGGAWVCTRDCGVHESPAYERSSADGGFFERRTGLVEVNVGPTTASPPLSSGRSAEDRPQSPE